MTCVRSHHESRRAPEVHGLCFVTLAILLSSCTSAPRVGPDKQFAGAAAGAISGAGTGAVTGFQLGATTGAGAAVGAGVGAVVGSVRGAIQDRVEEQMMQLAAATQRERRTAIAQEILTDQYARRLELHPNREIYPADLFFVADSAQLRPEGRAVAAELARLTVSRLPWSRMAVASYVKGEDSEQGFNQTLAQKRAKVLANLLVQGGVEPRRLEARGVVIPAPLLIDPQDDPLRYSQAIELIPLDR